MNKLHCTAMFRPKHIIKVFAQPGSHILHFLADRTFVLSTVRRPYATVLRLSSGRCRLYGMYCG